MRNFLLGVATTLVLTVAGGVGIIASIGRSDPGVTASPSASPSRADRPQTLARGETWLGDVSLSSGDVLTDGGNFLDVVAKGKGITLTDQGIRAVRLDLDATLPWAAASAQVGQGVTLYAAGPGRAGLSRTVTLLGQDVPVKATGAVRAENGLLVIEPDTVDLQGPDWLDVTASALVRSLVTIRQQVHGVPDGMRLTSVTVIDTGFRATLVGSDVAIAP